MRVARAATMGMLALATSLLVAPAASADTADADGLSYTYDPVDVEAGATLTGFAGLGTVQLDIPSEVMLGGQEYAVTAVAKDAFDGDLIEELTIPDSVTSIGPSAFYGNNIVTLTIPDSVTSMGVYAFYANDIETLTLGAGLDYVPITAFGSNTIDNLVVPEGYTELDTQAFTSNQMATVSLPDSLTTIGNWAFRNNSLLEVTIPENVTAIGEGAFKENPDLADVVFTGPAPTIAYETFAEDAPGAPEPLISYYWRYDESNVGAGGFTSPTWAGYDSQAIAIVEFDLGNGETLAAQEVVVGTTATEPTATVPDGWSLDGWFTAPYGGQEWDFSTDTVSGDTTLYAQWTSPEFVDVGSEHPFYDEVRWMSDQMISTGYGDGTFRPTGAVSRQAMSAFLYRAAGSPDFDDPATSPFPDVPTDHPFFTEIAWMDAEGISTGYDDGTFRASAPVSRQAMAAFLYRVAGEPGPFDPETPPFSDVGEAHPFYAAIVWMDAEGISTGYDDGTYRPTATVSRQAMAAFLFRMYTFGD